MNKFPFRLIQLGQIKKDCTDYKNLDSLVKFHYMGHAEFEWGALPAACGRMLNHFDEYEFRPTGLSSADGKRLMVFTRDPEVPEAIKSFANRPNPNIYWDTKDPTLLEEVKIHPAVSPVHFNFWWCIDDPASRYEPLKGDWMAVFEDDTDDLLKVLRSEKEAWDKLSEDKKRKVIDKW